MSAVLKSDKLRELRVLIVDDNSADRFLYKQLLEESDPATEFRFLEADSSRTALDRIQEGNLDCVLLDYLLPDMVGLDVLKAVGNQAANGKLPFIMLTGFGDEATAVSALQGGAHGYISKRDLDGGKLILAIDQAIRAHKDLQLQEKSRQEMTDKNRELESKCTQVKAFYQQVLGKLKKPVFELRDHMTDLANEDTCPVTGTLQTQLTNLRAETERLVGALKNLMDNPGLEVGALLISTRPESLVELVTTTVNSFRTVADAAGVRLSVKIQPGLPVAHIDRYRIEQVLGNLLDNAIRFTPRLGRVVLSLDCLPESPDAVTVSVIDTGCGIHPDQLAGLFDSKIHTLSDGAGAAQGMGLGLKVCKEIIQSHQGQISARSLPQAGTCIMFTLPLETRKKPRSEVWEHVSQTNGTAQWGLEA